MHRAEKYSGAWRKFENECVSLSVERKGLALDPLGHQTVEPAMVKRCALASLLDPGWDVLVPAQFPARGIEDKCPDMICVPEPFKILMGSSLATALVRVPQSPRESRTHGSRCRAAPAAWRS